MTGKAIHLLISLLCYDSVLSIGLDFGLCSDKHITCDCGSTGHTITIKIKQCTWFYRWEPYCKPCERDLDENAICSQYQNCLECNPVKGEGCLRCPENKYGKFCNGVHETTTDRPVRRSTTSPGLRMHCDAGGNRYEIVPGRGCKLFRQYDLQNDPNNPAGELPCGPGTLFDVNICVCNHAYAVTCPDDGIASSTEPPRPLCTVPDPASLDNGRVIVLSSDRLEYVCDEWYTLHGAAVNQCYNGRWVNIAPRCVSVQPPTTLPPVTCAAPSLPHHAKIPVTERRRGLNYPAGSRIHIECEAGFIAEGSDELYCQEDGTWFTEEEFSCRRVESCEDPGVPRNTIRHVITPNDRNWGIGRMSRLPSRLGRNGISITSGSHLESTFPSTQAPTLQDNLPEGFYATRTRLVYSCENRNYKLVGSRHRTCTRNGRWSGRQPACIPVCGRAGGSRTPFITHGNTTEKGQWPWQVAILRNDSYELAPWQVVCGGALLNEHWMITAGHCVVDRETNNVATTTNFRIHLGRYYRNVKVADEYLQEFQPLEIHLHPEYDPFTLDSDIALIKLPDVGATLSDRVRPVCLPENFESYERVRPGSEGIVTGWGKMENGQYSNTLRQAAIPVIDSEACEQAYDDLGYVVPVTVNMFCAGYHEGNVDACAGDSGSPMVFSEGSGNSRRWYVEGLVSWGSPSGSCGAPNEYGGYTRISQFLNWIHEFV